MANQLWSDERIGDRIQHYVGLEFNSLQDVMDGIEAAIREMRDEYEAVLPDVVTREALRNCLENPSGQTFRDARYALIWLDRLENT